MGINNFKDVNLHFLQGIRFNIFLFKPHHRLLKSFNKATISLRHLGKSILYNSVDFIFLFFGSWVSLWNFETIRGSLMMPKGQTLASLAQEICTLLFQFFGAVFASKGYILKNILEGNLYLGPLEIILQTLASGMTFRLPVITCPVGGYKLVEF